MSNRRFGGYIDLYLEGDNALVNPFYESGVEVPPMWKIGGSDDMLLIDNRKLDYENWDVDQFNTKAYVEVTVSFGDKSTSADKISIEIWDREPTVKLEPSEPLVGNTLIIGAIWEPTRPVYDVEWEFYRVMPKQYHGKELKDAPVCAVILIK